MGLPPPSTMPWMDQAWSMIGQSEVAGSGANPEIVGMFAAAGVPELTSDETAWCAAMVSACLARAGLKVPDRVDGRLDRYAAVRAVAFLEYGTPIETPRPGAIAVLSRGINPAMGHVGFVTGADAKHVYLLGGNQASAVNITPYPKSRVRGYRWPAPPATAKELAASGSRTVATAQRQQSDAIKSTSSAALPQAVPSPEASGFDPSAIAEQARETQGILQTFLDFGMFVWAKAPIVGLLISGYFVARMAHDAGWISWFRCEDHNSGANQGRAINPTGGADVVADL